MSAPPPLRSPLARLFLIAVLPALLVYVVLLRLSTAAGIDTIEVIRDLAQTCDEPIGVGLMPNLGILMWTTTAALTLFATGAGLVVQRRWRRLLLLGGGLSLLLAVDDFFLLHDRYIGATFLYLLYAVLAVTILVVFRDLLFNSGDGLAFVAAACFLGASVLLDYFQLSLPIPYNQVQVVEEGVKFIGIACWLLFWWRAAAYAAKLRSAS